MSSYDFFLRGTALPSSTLLCSVAYYFVHLLDGFEYANKSRGVVVRPTGHGFLNQPLRGDVCVLALGQLVAGEVDGLIYWWNGDNGRIDMEIVIYEPIIQDRII